MAFTLFVIPNCQTVKKARDWLSENKIDYVFYDFKKKGVSKELIDSWLEQYEITQILNKSGMTYRNLSEEQKLKSQTVSGAVDLLIEFPSMIKRPILDNDKNITVGFKEDIYHEVLKNL